MIEMRMDGRCALITGASKGIGFAAASNFVRAGANVAIVARRPDVLEEACAALGREGKGKVVAIAADVSKAPDCARIFATAEKELGRVDVLVNNAATNPYFGAATDIDLARYDKTFQVNLRGPLVWTQAAVAHGLGGRPGAAVVNVASIGGMTIEPGIGIYNTTKAALVHLTKVLGSELGPAVRVNAVAPGLVKTDMARGLWEGKEEAIGRRMPTGRLGEPADIANAILFLLSDAASWITGHTLVVDGGALVAGR